VILGWTVLRPSARERRLWLVAVAAAGTISAALLAAATLADPRHPVSVWSAAIVSGAAAAWTAIASQGALRRRFEVAIGADGGLLARRVDASETTPQHLSRTVFISPWLITLRCGATLIPIWPDSVDTETFRRLVACARWAGMADPAGAGIQDSQTGSRDDSAR